MYTIVFVSEDLLFLANKLTPSLRKFAAIFLVFFKSVVLSFFGAYLAVNGFIVNGDYFTGDVVVITVGELES